MSLHCSFFEFRFLFTFVLLLLSSHSSCGFVNHQKFKPPSNSDNVVYGRYIVELDHQFHVASFVDSLTKSFTQQVQVLQQFTHPLFNGVSFTLNSSIQHIEDLKLLLDHHSVIAVHPCRFAHAPALAPTFLDHTSISDSGNISDMISPHHLTQVDRVHKELEYTGKGILIGIIDSGVDYFHPALGGGFGDGYKIRFGSDLVGDEFNTLDAHPTIKSGPTPLDTCGPNSGSVGHGTHVAGIIGGKSENFTGVAPDATLAAWRIFGCNGGTTDDIIVQALLMAEETGCDIINLSIGDMNGWSETLTSVVASRISQKGIHVVSSVGNQGLSGAFTIGSPSTGKGVISVASFDNEYNLVPHFMAVGSVDRIPYHTSTGYDETYPSGELVADDSLSPGCSVDTSVQGKYSLVKEGYCSLGTKASNLAQAGAIGMVIYNDSKDYPYRPLGINMAIPILGIGRTNGQILMNRLLNETSEPIKLLFLGQLPAAISSAKTVSIFSSVGATVELDLRPHLSGIGGNVYSTLPRQLGSWGVLSGSSMASPYVAGSVALYLNSLGNKTLASPKVVLEHFQNYAFKAPVQNGKDNLDSPLRQGAGLVQVYDTIMQTVHVTPGHISFNDTSSNKYNTHILDITNHGKEPVSFQILNNVSLSVVPFNIIDKSYMYLEPINYTTSAAKLQMSKKSIKVTPGKSTKIKVTVIPPKSDPKQHIMYGGYIQFKSRNPTIFRDLSVPYFGIVGKQKNLPVLGSNTPFIIDGHNTTITYDKHSTYTFNLSSIDDHSMPQLALRFVTGTRRVNYELVDTVTRSIIGHIFPASSYLPRNTIAMPFFLQPLRGTYYPTSSSDQAHSIPAGTYRIRIKALHLFGNPGNPKDYQVQESSIIQVIE